MPLYEYRCQACNRLTEKRQKFSDPEITVCPLCGGHLERTITAPAIQFKGGGWYADGYGNKKPAANPDSTASADSGKSDSNTGENKSADSSSKTESKNTESKTESKTPAPAPASPPPSTAAPK